MDETDELNGLNRVKAVINKKKISRNITLKRVLKDKDGV